MSNRQQACLALRVHFDPSGTDAESLATAFDRLLTTASSMPGILEEYGSPTFGEFLVTQEPESAIEIVVNVQGGVAQDVFCSAPRAKVTVVDWDAQGPGDFPGQFEVETAPGRRQGVAVSAVPALPFSDLAGTEVEAALRAADPDFGRLQREQALLGRRELATTLAALRLWQRYQSGSLPAVEDREQLVDVATDSGEFTHLSSAEIDALCDKLNKS